MKPNSGGDDTRGALAELIAADNGRGGLLACTLYARHGRVADPIYVHAKVGIVDDRWLTIGSANLNEHSLFNDTEMNIVCHDQDVVRSTRLRLWAEHLELPLATIEGDPKTIIDRHWKPTAEQQLARRQVRPTAHTPTRPTPTPLAPIRKTPRTTPGTTRRRLELDGRLVRMRLTGRGSVSWSPNCLLLS